MRFDHHHYFHDDPDTKRKLGQIINALQSMENNIMTAISDFVTNMTAFFDRQDTAVTDLQGDVKSLTDQIAALQNSNGTITPADQTLLDGIQARAKTIADKLDALDALTPPVIPPAATTA